MAHRNQVFAGNWPIQLSRLLGRLEVFFSFLRRIQVECTEVARIASSRFAAIAFLCIAATAPAAEYKEAEQLLFSGKYDQATKMAAAEVDRGVWNEKWPTLLVKCYLTTGEYKRAEATYEAAKARFKNSISLRLIGHEVYNFVDKPDVAKQQYSEIMELVQRSPWRYSSSSDRVVIGRFLLDVGEDAREVLELAFDKARKSNPKLPDVYIATAELALGKHDYQEAAKSLEPAIELQPNNPYVHFLNAKAWASSDPEKTAAAMEKSLELNPNHVPTLLMQVDNLIDGEKYDQATKRLKKVLAVNSKHPEAWAYKAVIAHLKGDEAAEKSARKKALSTWSTNPHVDHLIGKKLSRNYRFAEGAEYQRSALKLEPGLLKAKLQLSQDYLRLGKEESGWRLADAVHEADGYNVVAYNAVTLRDQMKNYSTIETDRFVLRMDSREAKIYGEQVISLLDEAHDFLCDKYEVELDGPVTVEIFPQQKDFAIRTFGMPGGAGYLGVCFGRVITANSPSSQGERPANWRSVLWHEFCHVVTLEKTRNKMPRWVSEGISTYEEQEKNDAWGEKLTPQYRQMIASDEELTPVSQLSAAFLSPKSPQHLQFAYYESALVIRFLVERHGNQTLKRILTDLGVGMPINEALERYVGSLEKLDKDFAEYARKYVSKVAPKVDWELDESIGKMDLAQLKAWLKTHPNNYFAMTRYAKLAIDDERYEEAEATLDKLRELHPNDREGSGVLALLAMLHKKRGDTDKEIEALESLASLNDRALEAYARLMELKTESEDWEAVRENANRYLSVQPMLPFGHEKLASAAEQLDKPDDLAKSLSALLEMDPVDPAEAHYRISLAHEKNGALEKAKRHVLMALEYAPRYRDAQRQLLKIAGGEKE